MRSLAARVLSPAVGEALLGKQELHLHLSVLSVGKDFRAKLKPMCRSWAFSDGEQFRMLIHTMVGRWTTSILLLSD